MCWRLRSFPVDCPAHIDVPSACKPYCHRATQEGLAIRGVSDQLRDQDDYQNVKWNRGAMVSSDTTVRGHRHDQTVAGVLATRLGMRLSSEWLWVSSAARRTMPIDPKTRIVLVLISSEVRKYVFDHDGGQYQYCGATQNLEFDHIKNTLSGGSWTSGRGACRRRVPEAAIAWPRISAFPGTSSMTVGSAIAPETGPRRS